MLRVRVLLVVVCIVPAEAVVAHADRLRRVAQLRQEQRVCRAVLAENVATRMADDMEAFFRQEGKGPSQTVMNAPASTAVVSPLGDGEVRPARRTPGERGRDEDKKERGGQVGAGATLP